MISKPSQSVQIIGDSAFSYTNLVSATIQNGIIDDYAFYGCEKLSNVILEDGVEKIGYACFLDCRELKDISLPNTLTSIEDRAFEGCRNLTEIFLPKNLSLIGDSVFQLCRGLSIINVDNDNSYFMSKDGVLFSKDGTILYCYPPGKMETSYVVPEGVTIISRSAFPLKNYSEYVSLTTIRLPKSVEIIEYAATGNCANLTDVFYEGNESDKANIVFPEEDNGMFFVNGNEHLLSAIWHYNQ